MAQTLRILTLLLCGLCLLVMLAALPGPWSPVRVPGTLAEQGVRSFHAESPRQYMLDIPLESLENTLRRIEFDEANGLVLTQESEQIMRRLLTRLPDLSRQDILIRLEFLIHRGWQADQAEQLIALVRRYLEFAEAERQWESNEARQLPDLERLSQIKALRRHYFSEHEAAILFGAQELLSEYLVRRQAIQRDDSLTPTQRREALRTLEQTMQGLAE